MSDQIVWFIFVVALIGGASMLTVLLQIRDLLRLILAQVEAEK